MVGSLRQLGGQTGLDPRRRLGRGLEPVVTEPEGLESGMTKQDLADLIAFLKTPK